MSDRSKIFTYAIIHHPEAEKADEKDPPSKILVEPTNILARDERSALMLAARAVPADYVDKLEEVEIAVRPF